MGPSWIGDMVMAQSLYKSLINREPDSEIHVVAHTWSITVLGRMPEVDRILEFPVGHGELALKKRWEFGQKLQKEGYEQAIILPRSLKASLVPVSYTHLTLPTKA